jgi:hypothetical protein
MMAEMHTIRGDAQHELSIHMDAAIELLLIDRDEISLYIVKL